MSPGRRVGLFDGDELDVEDEGGVGGDDAAGASGAVGEVAGDGELAFAADAHAGDAFVPAGD
ncbi:MAG: hypothetical protein JWQ02_2431, partial [Capsulimonas sp.]|nr:hypothetical protein [Capsulimonas sp.]